jgi:nucleotide-binding universal stress UspA family protein
MKAKSILIADEIDTETAEGKKRAHAINVWATFLSKKLKRPLKLVTVEDLTLYPVSQPVYRQFIQNWVTERKSKLSERSKALKAPVNASLLEGYPAQKLIELTARGGSYELVILGSHGRTGMKRLMLGSVAEEVIRHSRLPVLTIGPKALEVKSLSRVGAAPATGPLKILIATDLTDNGKNAEKYGLELAKQLSAEVVLFHSLLGGFHSSFQPAFLPEGASVEFWDITQEVKGKVDAELKKKQRKFTQNRLNCTVQLDSSPIGATAAILKAVKKSKADLVIMGTHGRNLVSGSFFGNTARQLILNSPVPVITVKSRK